MINEVIRILALYIDVFEALNKSLPQNENTLI